MTIVQIIAIACAIIATCLLGISTLGLFKLPNFFTRLHATGIGDILGGFLMIVSLILLNGLNILSVKLFLVFAFIALVNPFGTNIIMIAAANKKNYLKYKDTEVITKEEKK